MTPSDRQSVVWSLIERMAFRPNPVDTWCALYECTIHRLWELQPGDVSIQRKTKFELPFLNIVCEYHVEQVGEKYDARILLMGNRQRLVWAIHVDPAYLSKAALHKDNRRYPTQDLNRRLKGDVESVLNGMVFHPRNHTHLGDCGIIPNAQGGLDLPIREIRVGGGIENVFVFLFHLRYQFCLVSEETRTQEKNRLIDLFTSAIKESRLNVPPAELFSFRR
jgi:hypothetical protein